MKTAYIQRIILATILAGGLCACTDERIGDPPEPVPETRGVMEVEVLEKNGEAVDRIGSIRFFVFDNPLSAPVMEINRFYGENDFLLDQAVGENEVSKLRVVFEVGYRPGGNNSKLVVAVANEPASLSSVLDQVTVPGDLEGLTLDFAEFLNAGHTALLDGAAMPMTSAVITSKVYRTEQQAKADPAEMQLERAVARVEVYLTRGTDVDADVKLAAGTNVTLGNTYGREYFIYHPLGNGYTLGRIQTVTAGFLTRTWTLSTNGAEITPDVPVCSFYAAERSCVAAGDADKLRLDIEVMTSEGALRTGGISIARALDENQHEQTIDAIRRNNIYRVTASVDANGITCIVHDWNTENIEQEL